jgi:hypothetical protein
MDKESERVAELNAAFDRCSSAEYVKNAVDCAWIEIGVHLLTTHVKIV